MRCNRGGRRDFPGAAAFRPISWEEWFENFDQHHCSFVFDNDRSMPLSNTYRIVNADEWKARAVPDAVTAVLGRRRRCECHRAAVEWRFQGRYATDALV
jgi:hypothetical protein